MTMGNERATQAQFELMVSFMERHGDIQCLSDRMESHRRWLELIDLLNAKSLGESKSIDKWRKCWSDFKNNTKRKALKISRNEVKVDLSKLEKRVLKLREDKKGSKRKTSDSDNENSIIFKMETEAEKGPCEMPPSPRHCYLPEVERESSGHSNSSASSSASVSSNEETPTQYGKRKRSLKDNIKAVAEKYLEFEREREKLAHEREMARIKQNDQLVTIFGRIVNVLETLTPSIQKYLDRDTNDDR